MSKRRFRKILAANRGEIAIRVFRAANELGIRTVAVYAEQDKLSLHRFKADESYPIGEGLGPVKAYLSIEEMLRVARDAGCDAVHPGYGFLSENPDFAEACAAAGIAFIGPPADVMRTLGNKVSARAAAEAAGTPVMPATGPLPDDPAEIGRLAEAIGYPLMLKASWGGGGRGMRVIETADALQDEVVAGRREAEAAFGNGEVYLEKLVRHARHVEVQLLGDEHGNLVHLFERDCSMQRRNQKMVERAPAPYLTELERAGLCEAALKLARHAGYRNAGTAECLMDVDDGRFYFIEVNPRIQVEHTVSEEVTGIDIVKAQIRIAEGGRIGVPAETGVPAQDQIRLHGHALQVRITTEDPDAHFTPDYGRITAYRGATGFGIRLDGGTAYSGAVITRYYDSLLEKVTAWAPTAEETIDRMDRALREFRIRGVATNLVFVENLINHPRFRAATTPRASSTTHRSCSTSPSGATAPPGCSPSSPTSPSTATRRSPAGPCRRRIRRRRHHARCAPVAAGDAHALLRHGADRRGLCPAAARTDVARMLGRGHLRRGHALFERVSLDTAARAARAHPQRPVPDAAARRQRRRLHQLSRQRGPPVRRPGGRQRHRSVPCLRLA